MPGAAGSGGMETSTETALENPLKKLSIHGGKLGGAARKAGRTGKPARMSAHDLGHGHATDVIHGGIPDDFL